MNKITIISGIYVLGILIGALLFGLWSENTIFKSIIALIWTAIFLIALVYADNNKS